MGRIDIYLIFICTIFSFSTVRAQESDSMRTRRLEDVIIQGGKLYTVEQARVLSRARCVEFGRKICEYIRRV